MNRNDLGALLVMASIMASCQLDSGPTGERVVSGLENGNHLALNHLALNHLALNHLALNQLALSQLELEELGISEPLPGQYVFHSNGMEATPQGRDALRYLASCALPEGSSLLASHDGVEYEFPGLFGVTPDWVVEPLGADDKRWLTACLLSHVNAYGISVQISVRAPGGVATATAEEMATFPVYEATFFGDFFADSARIYACQGSRFDVASAHSPDRALRVCSDDTEDCGIRAVGPCYRVCNAHINKYGATGCTVDGITYDQTFSVWLHDPDEQGVNASCAAGTDCDLDCVGSACSDAVFNCAETDSCETNCAMERTCTTDCSASDTCQASCSGGTCDVDCTDSDQCRPTCSQGSDCAIDCRGSSDCSGTTCRGGSECLLICDVDDPECGFFQCLDGSGITECGGGVIVCNRPCP